MPRAIDQGAVGRPHGTRPRAGHGAGLALGLGLTVGLLAQGAAAELEPWSRRSTELAPGLVHHVLCSAAADGATRVVLALGPFSRQREADAWLARVEVAAGQSEIRVATSPEGYEIRVAGLAGGAEAQATQARLAAAGIETRWLEIGHDPTHPGGPFDVQVLEIDPARVEVVVARAVDAAIGVESTRSLARRHGALAAINGGFYVVAGPTRGDSEGVLMIDGRLLSEPDRGRAGAGFFVDGGRVRAAFARLDARLEARLADGTVIALDGVNRERRPGEVIAFTPEFHRTTLTGPEGTEVLVSAGRVLRIRSGAGSSRIPADGFVLSFAAGRRAPELAPGDPVELATELVSLDPDPERLWPRVTDALGAGPLLLASGRRVEAPEAEAISRVFGLARHPRTAVGARADGTLLAVIVDGRQPGHSVGMSLGELTDLFLDLGAVDAVNLDGGGSTTMVIRGEIVNQPSDRDGERENGDALLFYPRGTRPPPP